MANTLDSPAATASIEAHLRQWCSLSFLRENISKCPIVSKRYFCVYPCSPFQPPCIPVKWGLPSGPVSNQPTGWLLLFCNNILISTECCFDEGLLLLLLIYWSAPLTPTRVIKCSQRNEEADHHHHHRLSFILARPLCVFHHRNARLPAAFLSGRLRSTQLLLLVSSLSFLIWLLLFLPLW